MNANVSYKKNIRVLEQVLQVFEKNVFFIVDCNYLFLGDFEF